MKIKKFIYNKKADAFTEMRPINSITIKCFFENLMGEGAFQNFSNLALDLVSGGMKPIWYQISSNSVESQKFWLFALIPPPLGGPISEFHKNDFRFGFRRSKTIWYRISSKSIEKQKS